MAWLISSSHLMPGINFDTPVTIEDLNYEFNNVFSVEQRNRLQAIMGGYLTEGAHYGIVDPVDPRTAPVGSSRPFAVSINGIVSVNVDVKPGVAITKAGNIIVLDLAYTNLALASTDYGTSNIVYVEYSTVDDTTTNTLTRYNTVEARRRILAPINTVLKTATLTDYNNPVVFPDSRKNDMVVLAVVTNNSNPAGLVIDLSNNTNSFNRPWFSPVDNEHRSFIGTGSAAVPHRLGMNELSQGNLTLYQQMLRHGVVISKDYDVPGCPGKLNVELINLARLYTDSDGTVTGTIGYHYVRLMSYPTRILAARNSTSTVDEDIAVFLVPHSNVLVFQPGEQLPDSTHSYMVYYTSSPALEPPVANVVSHQMTFGTPDATRELYVSGGKGYNDLISNVLDLGNLGPFPMEYKVFIDGTKQFLTAPQVVGCVKYIDPSNTSPAGIGTANQTPEFSMFGNARIIVGLNSMSSPPPSIPSDFNVVVEIVGKDISGVALTEDVSFDQSNFIPVAIPVSDCGFGSTITNPPTYIFNPTTIYLKTASVFSSVTSWAIKSYVSMDPQTVVMLWADLSSPLTTTLNDLLPVSDIRWNGEGTCRILDIRPVSSTIQRSEFMDRILADVNSTIASVSISQQLASGANQKLALVAADDFNNPHWMDNTRTQNSRFSDGLQSYFYPGPSAHASVTTSDFEKYAEFYYTRALFFPIVSSQYALYVTAYMDKYYLSTSPLNIVQYRLATIAAPTVWGSWTNSIVLNSRNTSAIPLTSGGPYLKIQLRFVAHDTRGFTAIMSGT